LCTVGILKCLCYDARSEKHKKTHKTILFLIIVTRLLFPPGPTHIGVEL